VQVCECADSLGWTCFTNKLRSKICGVFDLMNPHIRTPAHPHIFPLLFLTFISMNPDIKAYNKALSKADKAIADLLAAEIDNGLPKAENKIWHRHPVWFLEGNPIVGYSKLKDSVRLLFWSGQSFEEDELQVEGSFKAAEARYTSVEEVDTKALRRWLAKSKKIQWDYKNIVKRKGVLVRLK
jgi:hypothetical protein